jgi:hypothetical protein
VAGLPRHTVKEAGLIAAEGKLALVTNEDAVAEHALALVTLTV